MGLTVYGGGGKPEEEKTVTAGTSVIVVNPSSGKVMKKVTVNPTPTESKSVTPTTSELTVTPSAGKHLSQVVVGAVEDVTPEVTAQTPLVTQILEGLIGKAQGATATADKILEGYSAYVGQELLNGTAKQGRLGIDFGELTTTAVSSLITIEHNLGVVPSHALLFVIDEPGNFNNVYTTLAIDGFTYRYQNQGIGSNSYSITKTDTEVTFTAHTTYGFGQRKFMWIAVA